MMRKFKIKFSFFFFFQNKFIFFSLIFSLIWLWVVLGVVICIFCCVLLVIYVKFWRGGEGFTMRSEPVEDELYGNTPQSSRGSGATNSTMPSLAPPESQSAMFFFCSSQKICVGLLKLNLINKQTNKKNIV